MDFSMDFSEIAEGKVLNFSLFSDWGIFTRDIYV
jgi:hypothetical protein